jgi:hypothetical protein
MSATTTTREGRPFYLVQRLLLSPYVDHQRAYPRATVKSNPFGYGRMGDYELDYMGAAEFEFGEIPKAHSRLVAVGKDLVLAEFEYRGHALDFLYIGKEGEPFDEWLEWAEGRERGYDGKVHQGRGFEGKKRPHELEQRLNGEDPPKYNDDQWRTAIWWALRGNVLWAFKEDGHLHRWIDSMGSSPTEFLR